MDDAVQKALKRRDELRRELEKIDNFLEVYKEFSRTEPEQSVPLSPQEPVDNKGNNDSHPVRPSQFFVVKSKRPAKPRDIVAASAAILRAAGHPMTRGQLNGALKEFGVIVPGSDPARYVGTIMWRNQDTFESIEGRGYWLKGEPLPDDF